MSILGIGVLGDDALYMCREQRNVKRVAANFAESDLIENIQALGITHNLSAIWIAPGSRYSEYALDHADEIISWQKSGYECRTTIREYHKRKYPVSIAVSTTTGSYAQNRRIFAFIPQADSRWGNDDGSWSIADNLEKPLDLLGTLVYLREELGAYPMYSPGWSGQQLMKARFDKHMDWLKPCDLSLYPNHREGDILWKRPLTAGESEKRYLHFYDKSSAYPAAATGAQLGEGSPRLTTTYEPKSCGKWRIRFLRAETGTLMYTPATKLAETWAITPVVEQYRRMGIELDVVEGLIWDRHHRALADWAKSIWDSRTRLKQSPNPTYPNDTARESAYQMLKLIYNQAIGWLDLSSERHGEKGPWHRPDWKDQIVGLARARMLLKAHQIAEQYGLHPCLIYVDTLAYCSNERPETAVPDLMRRSGELGGFRHVRTVRLTDQLIAMFADSRVAAKDILHVVKGGNNG
jgi:hypothetical protein